MPGTGVEVGASYGDLLVTSLLVLGAVCIAAFIAVRFFGRYLSAGRVKGSHLLDVVARVPLEPRRSLYVVEVAGKTLLVGTSEMGLSVLSELDGDEVKSRAVPAQSFADLVRGAWNKRKGLAPPPADVSAETRRDSGSSNVSAETRSESRSSSVPAETRRDSGSSNVPAETLRDLGSSNVSAETRRDSGSSNVSAETRRDSGSSNVSAETRRDSGSSDVSAETRSESRSSNLPAETRSESRPSNVSAETRRDSDSSNVPAETRRDSGSSDVPAETQRERESSASGSANVAGTRG